MEGGRWKMKREEKSVGGFRMNLFSPRVSPQRYKRALTLHPVEGSSSLSFHQLPSSIQPQASEMKGE